MLKNLQKKKKKKRIKLQTKLHHLEVQQIVEDVYGDNEFHYIEMHDESEIEGLEDSFKFTKFEITFCKTT